MNMERFPAISLLLEGYFHQDWACEGMSSDEIIGLFCQGEPRTTVIALQDEITTLVDAIPEEAGLRQIIVSQLGLNFDPASEGKSLREWLLHVRATAHRFEAE